MVNYIESSTFIETDSSIESETQLSKQRILFLTLKLLFDKDRYCYCSGSAFLKESGTNMALETHSIDEFTMKGGGCFLGAWDKFCEKKGVSYNLATFIDRKEFGKIWNETILEFSIFPNGVLVSSNISKVVTNSTTKHSEVVEEKEK